MPDPTAAFMQKLHDALGAQLLQRITSGEATSSELNVARQFLKDNHVDAVPTAKSSLSKLLEELPEAFEDDYE